MAKKRKRYTSQEKLQYEYWVQFRSFLEESKSPVKPQKPRPQHWMDFGVGRSGFHLSATLNTSAKRIGVDLYIENSSTFFDMLHQDKISIESEIGSPLEWKSLPEKKDG